MDQTLVDTLAAKRAIVVLLVPWSGYALRAFQTLADASKQLSSIGITFVAFDEDSQTVRDWLKQNVRDWLKNNTGTPFFDGTHSLGSGTLIWLERGTVVDVEVGGAACSLDELLVRTRDRWERSGEASSQE
jgi:hypothetical protein